MNEEEIHEKINSLKKIAREMGTFLIDKFDENKLELSPKDSFFSISLLIYILIRSELSSSKNKLNFKEKSKYIKDRFYAMQQSCISSLEWELKNKDRII